MPDRTYRAQDFTPGMIVLANVSQDYPRAYALGNVDPNAVRIEARVYAVEGDYGIGWLCVELTEDRDLDLHPCDYVHIPADRCEYF